MENNYDVVFLHSGGKNLKGLQGPFIPIGMVGLASILKKNGHKVKIFNLLMEKVLDKDFTDEGFLETINSHIFCIDLQWFVHSYEAIELARLVKVKKPNSYVTLGGITASYFAEEILKSFEFIDCITKGESEIPIKMLVEQIKNSNPHLDEIPNLVYRIEERIQNNKFNYTIDNELLDNINFLQFELVNNWNKMFHLYNMDYQYKRDSECKITDYYQPNKMKFWPVYTGRGCNFNCSFCGGSRNAFRRCFNRQKLILRNPVKVAEDILKLDALGIENVYIPHSPLTVNSAYHNKLLDELEKIGKKLNLGFMFEDFPFFFDKKVNERYCKIFNKERSSYLVYIGSFNEKIATLNNCYVPIERIIAIQNFCIEVGVTAQICILLGMPGEGYISTFEQARYIKSSHLDRCNLQLIKSEMHPASNIFCSPDKFGVNLEVKSFMEYYTFLKNKTNKEMFYGYSNNGEMDVCDQFEIVSSMLKKSEIN